MSDAQTLAEAGKPKVSTKAPGASDQTVKAGEDAPLYRVVAPRGFYSDQVYPFGSFVRFDGKPSEGVLELVKDEQSSESPKRATKRKSAQAEKPSDKEVL